MKLLAFLAIGLLAAGCAAPATTTADPTVDPPAPPMEPRVVSLDGCRQFHTFFESPIDGFAEFVPEGFAVKPSTNPQFTTIPVFASDCTNSTEMFALLQVVPPAEHANATFTVDAVILTAFVSNRTDLANYVAWGLPRMLEATTTSRTTNDLLAAHDEEITVSGGGATYTLHTSVQASPAVNPTVLYRYWAVNGTKATGYVIVENDPGETIGMGLAIYSSSGDPEAPPITSGIAHRVNGVPVLVKGHTLPPVAGNATA